MKPQARQQDRWSDISFWDLRPAPALGIQAEVLTLGYLHAFQAGLQCLLNSIWRHNLMKYDSQLTISRQPPGRPDLSGHAAPFPT